MGLNIDHLLPSFIFVLPAVITKGILNYLFSPNERAVRMVPKSKALSAKV